LLKSINSRFICKQIHLGRILCAVGHIISLSNDQTTFTAAIQQSFRKLHALLHCPVKGRVKDTWNSLPQNVCDCSSLASFRNHLKTRHFSSAFSALSHLVHICLDSNLTTALINHLHTYLHIFIQCFIASTSLPGHSGMDHTIFACKQRHTCLLHS